MKLLMMTLLLIYTLHAGIFSSDDKQDKQVDAQNKEIQDKFRQNVSDANAIIKRGEYKKINQYASNSTLIIEHIEELDISLDEKQKLIKDIKTYSQLINDISIKLQKKSPKLNTHYTETISKLEFFNSKLSSIGLSQLLSNWRDLSRIKNRFVKKPSESLEKEFDDKWSAIVVTITELYLDDDMQEPLLDYLESYKAYFKEIKAAYASVSYKNIKRLKPLSYSIKAQLELLIPYKM